MGRWTRPTVWAYLMLLHAIVLLACWKSDLLPSGARRIGLLPPLPPTPAQRPVYQQIEAFQIKVDGNTPDGSVLFFGDSLIQGLCVAAVTPQAINFGIGGDTTAGLLARLPRYQSVTRCRTVVLAIGVNDFDSLKNDEVLQNYRRLLQSIPVPVMVSAILPVDERGRPPLTGYNARIRDFNRDLAELCHERPECRFIDAGPPLRDGDGQLAALHHVGDGVHLNAAGNTIWIAGLRNAFESIKTATQP